MFSIAVDTTKLQAQDPEGQRNALCAIVRASLYALMAGTEAVTLCDPETTATVGAMALQTDDPAGCDNDTEALTAGVAALLASGDTVRAERLQSLLDWVRHQNRPRAEG